MVLWKPQVEGKILQVLWQILHCAEGCKEVNQGCSWSEEVLSMRGTGLSPMTHSGLNTGTLLRMVLDSVLYFPLRKPFSSGSGEGFVLLRGSRYLPWEGSSP